MEFKSFIIPFEGFGWNCFINSLMQALFSCPTFIDYLKDIYNDYNEKFLINSDREIEESLTFDLAKYAMFISGKLQTKSNSKPKVLKPVSLLKKLDKTHLSNCSPGDSQVLFLNILRKCQSEVDKFNSKYSWNKKPFDELFVPQVIQRYKCDNCDFEHAAKFNLDFFVIDSSSQTMKDGFLQSLIWSPLCKSCKRIIKPSPSFPELSPIVLFQILRNYDSPPQKIEESFSVKINENLKYSFSFKAIVLSSNSHATALARRDIKKTPGFKPHTFYVLFNDSYSTMYDYFPTHITNIQKGDRPYSRYLVFYETKKIEA